MLTPKVLSDKYTLSVYRLFQEKNWDIKTDESNLNTFDRFCQRMAELKSDEDRDFMLELSRDYLWIRSENYEKMLLEIFQKWYSCTSLKFDKNNMLYICPLLPPKDFFAMKSSKYMLYLCQSTALREMIGFHECDIMLFENPGLLKGQLDRMQALILIDDYIGSGETGIGCLRYIKDLGVDMKKIHVLSLVAQEEGILELQKEGVNILSLLICHKGISDKYPKEEVEGRLSRMKNIGKTINVQKNMRLGFGDSEALVTMIKTPNNTFPFYWYEKDSSVAAPFPRRNNVMMVSNRR